MSTATATTPRIGFESAGIGMTPDEFDAIAAWDDAYDYELIHGILVVTPIPSEAESDPNGELEYLLRRYREEHPEGAALDGTMPERYIHTANRRRADRVIWAGLGRRPDPRADVPTIAVEFLSSGKRDRHRDLVEKRTEYLEAGVREYWVIDRFQRRLLVFRAGEAELNVPEGGVYATPLLPGFELPVSRLLAVADRWGQS